MPEGGESVGAIVADVLACFGVPGSSASGTIVARYLRKKQEEGRDILLEEVRAGGVEVTTAANQDDLVGVIFRYMRAVQEGAARVNLRLLAKVIAGEYRRGSLVADEFLQHADALASMSRDELIVVAALYRAWVEYEAFMDSHPGGMTVTDPWAAAQQALSAEGMGTEEAWAAATRAQRTGLIYTGPTLDDMSTFKVSPTLIKLGKTVDFHDALRRETRR